MQPRRILVRLPTWVGDAVMATPALRALRAAQPGAWIGAQGRPALAGLLAGLAGFDAFLPDASRSPLARARELRAPEPTGPSCSRIAARLLALPRADPAPRSYARVPCTGCCSPTRLHRRRRADGGPDLDDRAIPARDAQPGCPDRGSALGARRSGGSRAGRQGPRAPRRPERMRILHLVTPGAAFDQQLWPPDTSPGPATGSRGAAVSPVLAPARRGRDRPGGGGAHGKRALAVAGPEARSPSSRRWSRALRCPDNDTGPRQIAIALGRPAVVLMVPLTRATRRTIWAPAKCWGGRACNPAPSRHAGSITAA
jgi:hypothetical protein